MSLFVRAVRIVGKAVLKPKIKMFSTLLVAAVAVVASLRNYFCFCCYDVVPMLDSV